MLYQLSYNHHATGRPARPDGECPTIVTETRPPPSSGLPRGGAVAHSIGRAAVISAAMFLAVSTSGPGPGTNTVFR